MRVTARHIEPGGIGYGLGYTTLEGFFPLYNGWDNWVVFVDGRGHVFNDGRPAANAGLGVRYLKTDRIWGLNSYYDYRKTHRQHYNQVAAGLESLGRIWDFRLNGYLPVGEKKSHNYRTRFDKFKGHHAILRQKFEFALAGANAEVGAHVDTWRHFPLYFAAGPYYLTGHGKSTWGGEGRLSVSIYDYLKLEGYTSYDHLFKWTCQGQVSLSYSFGPRKKVKMDNNRSCSDAIAVAKRAYQSVDRFEIIPVSRKHRHTTAINPRTGDPYYFWFVDNTSHSNGTFESPANVLQTIIADVIYVFPGDGTTTGMNSGITLQDNQRLWGSGFAQTLPTTVGTVIVPTMSSRGAVDNRAVLPIITNLSPGATVVTLGNNNEISGFFIENTTFSNAIQGTNVTNARVLNCSMGDALGQGLVGFSATDLAGKLKIDNCVFAQGAVGVLLANSSTNLKAKISDSNFNDTVEAIDWTLTNAARGTLKIKDSQMSTAATAIHVISEGTSSITANIKDSTIVANAIGILMDASTAANATQNLSVKNSLINTNDQGIFVTQVGQLNMDLTDNTLVSRLASLQVDTHGGSASIAGRGNSITTFDDHSILFNQNAGNLAAAFENNSIRSLAEDAVHVEMLSPASTHALAMTGNTIDAIGNGWAFLQQGPSASALWENNTVISGINGFLWTANMNATETNFIFDNNKISGLNLAIFGTQAAGQLNLSVTDNQLAGGNEVLVLFLNNSGTALNMSKNTLYGAVGQQLGINHNLGTFSASITENTFSGTGGINYVYGGGPSAGNSFQQIAGNTFFNSDVPNINIAWFSTGAMDATITGNTFQSVAQFSVITSISAGSQMLNLSDNTLVNAGGFELLANGGQQATWFVNGNDFVANGNQSPNPFVLAQTLAGAPNVCMQLNDNTAYPTAGAYVLDNSGTGTFILNPPQDNIGEISTTNVVIGKCP